MITAAELTPIGRTIKPHGINGEISTAIDNKIDLKKLRCLVMPIDGIFVPFFIETHRARGTEAVLIHLDGINNEVEAKRLCPKEVYALKTDICDLSLESPDDTDGCYADELIGYSILADGIELGKITDIDDSTDNALFIVTSPTRNTPLYIPATDDFVVSIDMSNRVLEMTLPKGLLEL